MKTFLENNPFYILEVLPTEKRTNIIAKAEEMSFLLDSNSCEEAQTNLLNPERRLVAELDWFCGLPVEQIVDINNCVAETRKIKADNLSGIAKLNAVLHNFEVSRYDDYFDLGYLILEIDELYNSVDLLVLLKNINNCRQQAGIREVSEDELRRGYTRKRDHIRQLISEKTTQLSKKDYIEFITMVAEKCIANADYNDGIVISDIIDQYEIKMQASIEEAADEIFSHIEGIKNYSNDDAIENGIDSLIHCVERWDRLVQPLQLKSMASGVTHNGSEEIGRELHQFSVWLHNEKGLSEESLRLINAIKPIFAEIGDLAALFNSDSDTLSNIIKGDKDAKQVVAEVDALKTRADNLKAYSTSTKVDEFIEKVKDINRKVRRSLMDDGLIVQLRESICYIARDVAITLHNNKEQTEYALRITKMLVAEFGDLEELKAKLSQDMSTLTQQILAKERIRRQQEAQEQAEKAKRIGCLVWIGIILLISLISGGLSECNSSGNSEPYVFSQSAESGDDVYVDIVSIEPEYSISTEGSYTSTDVACRCKTSDGKTVWVYMSVYQYNKYIDPDAKLSNSYSAEFETVRYSPAKRIHGEARKAEVLCDGLSKKQGQWFWSLNLLAELLN